MSSRGKSFEHGDERLANIQQLTELEGIATTLVSSTPYRLTTFLNISVDKPNGTALGYVTLKKIVNQANLIHPIVSLAIVNANTGEDIVFFEHQGSAVRFYCDSANYKLGADILQAADSQIDDHRVQALSRFALPIVQAKHIDNPYPMSELILEAIHDLVNESTLSREFSPELKEGEYLNVQSLERVFAFPPTRNISGNDIPRKLNISYSVDDSMTYSYTASSGNKPLMAVVGSNTLSSEELVSAFFDNEDMVPKSCDVEFLIGKLLATITPSEGTLDSEISKLLSNP